MTRTAAHDLGAIEAYKRAMPIQRLLGNGMDHADIVELYERVGTESWDHATAFLGDRNVARAEAALSEGHTITAQTWYLAAAACYRVGQVPLADSDPMKIRLYQQLIHAFGQAGVLSTPPFEHVEIPWRTGSLRGWLIRPSVGEPQPPTVIIVGGFDGWREEYYAGSTYLTERGIAVLLMDGPGQGETRLFGDLALTTDFSDAYRAMVSWILEDPRLSGIVGIWGNSMGGFLAAAAAINDERIQACCVNGGTICPDEFPLRYPRMIEKAQLMFRDEDPATTLNSLSSMTLTGNDLTRLHCPLLVLHGTPDPVFLVQNARALFDLAASADKTWREWPDGDHCLYNHSLEKHTIVADWFADRLLARTENVRGSDGATAEGRVGR